ncbi:MAG: ABC transporter permease subunit [Akkermansiaceae bacterium]|jgi:microcin C transport system permease protein|nr:ABC transporter permease subunit [Akkermansiaceae bacterium]
MNPPRKFGLILVFAAVLATVGHFLGLALPSLRWLYSFEASPSAIAEHSWRAHQARAVGLAFCSLMFLAGLALLRQSRHFTWNPITLRKIERFRAIGRGHASYVILIVLVVLALFDQALVGKRALAIKHEGKWTFPAFMARQMAASDYGLEGGEEPDYRELKNLWEGTDSLVILPPVPWDPTLDSDDLMVRPLEWVDGRLFESGSREPFSGYASCFHPDEPDWKTRSGRIRQGQPQWTFEVYDRSGETVGREEWRGGERISSTVPTASSPPGEGKWIREIYAPLPPSWERRHFLGTDSKGWDILAQLYGGLQVVFKGAALYLLLTYGIGVTLGCLMGYFGGAFDLVMQRLVEVLSNVPFLLVVLIISANIGRDNITLTTIILVFGVFSWIGIATYLRSSTYKEKARDYTAAARVLGAGTGRVIFRHILPNAIATIVTLVPFSISALVASLTALDFLGFGVPDSYPSWGRVLNDGLENLGAPWIVSSVFVTMVALLLLITFVGEAIREAFDPKKFTTYQ